MHLTEVVWRWMYKVQDCDTGGRGLGNLSVEDCAFGYMLKK